MIYLKLFIVFFQIGLFSFGGGYAAMPLIQSLVIDQQKWLTMAEFADITSIAGVTPGPIALNAATFVGQKLAGFPGAVICTLGCICPSVIIVLILAVLYKKYKDMVFIQNILGQLRPAVVALIASAGLSLTLIAFAGTSQLSQFSVKQFSWLEVVLFIGSLIMLRWKKISPVAVIFGSAVVGSLFCLLFSITPPAL